MPSGGLDAVLAHIESSGISVAPAADVAELADALDSKSGTRKSVWVRPPPSAPTVGIFRVTTTHTHTTTIAIAAASRPTTGFADGSRLGRRASRNGGCNLTLVPDVECRQFC